MNQAVSILVLGLGNLCRGDDGAGRVVAQRLRELALPEVEVREESGEGTALMEAWKNAGTVFLIDAALSGAAPGTIHRLDANEMPVPSRFFHYSTHAFSVAEAVELARALGRLPLRLILYGLEGQDFSAGEKLSPEIDVAAYELVRRVRMECAALQYGAASAPN